MTKNFKNKTRKPASKSSVGLSIAFFVSIFYLTLVGLLVLQLPLPMMVLYAYGGISVLTLLIYWLDKTLAVKNMRRVPERNLHVLSAFGGWPGALVAQYLFRHKNKKGSFQATFWLTVIINIGLFSYYIHANFFERLPAYLQLS